MVSIAAGRDASTSPRPWRDIGKLVWTIARANPWATFLQLLAGLLGNARTGLYIGALGGITQALIDRDQDRAILWASVYGGASVVEALYWPTKNYIQTSVLDRALHDIQVRVLGTAADTSLERFDSGGFYARLQRATDQLGVKISDIYVSLIDVLQVVVMFLSIMVPLWFIHPVIPVTIVACAIVPSACEQKTSLLLHAVKSRNATAERLLTLIEEALLNRNNAAELRLTGFSPSLVERWRSTREGINRQEFSVEATRRNYTLAGVISTSIGIALAFGLVAWLLLQGRADLGAWVAVTTGLQWGFGIFGAIPMVLRMLRENSAFLGDLFLFEDTAIPEMSSRSAAAAAATDPVPQAGMAIGATHVSFSYPGSERAVVDDVSLRITPGEHIAIVGENGAGKSTLVRLLTGLYTPSAGTVMQDGIDTRSAGALAHRNDIGAVFQDFVAWQLPLRDNVGFGDVERLDDDDALREALRKADLVDLLAILPDGVDTWLGREFGERDLSGGQWQRVALARAFFRDARFLVLDEPTAALDPLAEQRLFERFRDLAAGRTALTISHRLGPARTADRILVMSGGRIVESGTHDALVTHDGLYAEMFRAQSGWYK